eukprot:COSAG06_NODE_1921_length_8062_cov_113.020846_4_plen_51_part_00
MQLNFTMAADADVGKVDKSNGRVTYIGLPPLEMVRTHCTVPTVPDATDRS